MRNWIPVFCVRAELQTHQQPLLYGCVSQPWGHKPTGDCLEFKWGPLKCLVINFFLFADQIFFNYFLFKIIFMTNKMHTKYLISSHCNHVTAQMTNTKMSLWSPEICVCVLSLQTKKFGNHWVTAWMAVRGCHLKNRANLLFVFPPHSLRYQWHLSRFLHLSELQRPRA